MSRRSTGVVVLALLLNIGWAQGKSDTPRPVKFPYETIGPANLTDAVNRNIASGPYWSIYAQTDFAKKNRLTFEGAFDRVEKPGSQGGPARGFAQVRLTVRLGDKVLFTILDTAETPYTVRVTGNQSAYEVGFGEAEQAALKLVMPQACARLCRLAGEKGPVGALLTFASKRWPEDETLFMLRGVGPLAHFWSDRLVALIAAQQTERGIDPNTLLALLAVDEKRGAPLLASFAQDHRSSAVWLVNQHLELQDIINNAGALGGFPFIAIPWTKELSPAGEERMIKWVNDCPSVAVVCAQTLLEFPDDPRADALVRSLPELAPDQAGAIRELIADQARWKQERLEDEKRERERADEEKRNQQFADEEMTKEKSDEK